MKKSKLILPALASICLGAAASVSGTLAWFTADKNASVAINEFAVINPNGSLSASASNIINTTISSGKVSLDTGKKLTDASMDFTKVNGATGQNKYTVTCYKANSVGTDGSATAFTAVASPYTAISAQNIYRAAGFYVTFSYSGNGDSNLSVYFDPANSSYAPKTGQTKNNVLDSFRMAFYSDTADVFYWTPNRTSAVKHVTGTSTTADITGVTSAVKLGEVSPAGAKTTVSCTVYCYMWFDGCDANCNGTELEQMASKYATASLSFYAA